MMKDFLKRDGFDKTLDYEIVNVSKKQAILKCQIQEKHRNLYGYVHGGVYYSLSDAASGHIVSSYDGSWVTLSGSINYMKAAKEDALHVIASLVSMTSKTAVVDVVVESKDHRVYSKSIFTMYRID